MSNKKNKSANQDEKSPASEVEVAPEAAPVTDEGAEVLADAESQAVLDTVSGAETVVLPREPEADAITVPMEPEADAITAPIEPEAPVADVTPAQVLAEQNPEFVARHSKRTAS